MAEKHSLNQIINNFVILIFLKCHSVKSKIFANIAFNLRNGHDQDYFFNDLLDKCRFVIEKTNAMMDAFKSLLVRFETKKVYCKLLNLLAFTIILLSKF